MAEDPESGGEKTEDASSRKLGKAREQGQVAKSVEIPSVFVLVGGVIALWFSSGLVYKNLAGIFNYNMYGVFISIAASNSLILLLSFIWTSFYLKNIQYKKVL